MAMFFLQNNVLLNIFETIITKGKWSRFKKLFHIHFLPAIDSDAFLPYQYTEEILAQSDTEEGRNVRDIMKTVQR